MLIMLRFDKANYLSILFKFILFERLSNSLSWSDVLLFSEFITLVSVLFYKFIEFIILLYTFLVIFFPRIEEYIIFLISFNYFSGVLPAFTCTRAIGNLWSICWGVNILSCLWLKTWQLETLATRATGSEILVSPCPCFRINAFSRVSVFFLFWLILLAL